MASGRLILSPTIHIMQNYQKNKDKIEKNELFEEKTRKLKVNIYAIRRIQCTS